MHALVPLALLIGLQGLDVLVHAAAGQLEAIRVASNAIISVGAISSALGLMRARIAIYFLGLIYLALNLVFLVQNGVINPATDALRLPLIGFVILSLLLLAWMTRRLMVFSPKSPPV